MRSKKNKTFYNSWRLSGVATRDHRQIKDPDQDVGVGKPKPKNTRRWCRGKVGQEHKPSWEKEDRWWSEAYILRCTRCKKHLEVCWAFYKKNCKCGHHGVRRKY